MGYNNTTKALFYKTIKTMVIFFIVTTILKLLRRKQYVYVSVVENFGVINLSGKGTVEKRSGRHFSSL